MYRNKKLKTGESDESLLNKKKAQLMEGYGDRKRIPRGLMDTVYGEIRSGLSLSEDYTDYIIQKEIGQTSKNVEYWNKTFETKFERLWEQRIPDLPSDIDGDQDRKRKKEILRTCTVTLNQILRSDLRSNLDLDKKDHLKIIVDTLKSKQIAVTNDISELSLLAHKSILLVSR